MAALSGDVSILMKIKADASQAKSELRQTADAVKSAGSDAESGFKGFLTADLASAAIQRLSGSMLQGVKTVFDYSARMEQTKIGFTTLMGGADAATKHLKDLQDFAKATPFEFEGLTTASRRLQNVGLEAEKVIPVLTDIGNAAAAAGASSAELDSITLAFSQIIAKGKLSAEEVNQLAERGIPVWRMLSEQLGKSKEEIIDMAEKGKISSQVFLDAFQKFSKMNFGDAMEKQSHTFAGAMSSIKDSALVAAAETFEPIFKKIGSFADDVQRSLSEQEAKAKGAGASFGFAIGEGIGAGMRRSDIGMSENWVDWLLPHVALTRWLERTGRQIGEGLVKGYTGFDDTGNVGGKTYTLDPKTFTMQQVPSAVPGASSLPSPPPRSAITPAMQAEIDRLNRGTYKDDGSYRDQARAAEEARIEGRQREYQEAEKQRQQEAQRIEEARQKSIQAAEREVRDILTIYKAKSEKAMAILNNELESKLVSEEQYVQRSNRIRIEAAQDEVRLLDKLRSDEKLTSAERTRLTTEWIVAKLRLETVSQQAATETTKVINKQTEATAKLAQAERDRNAELERKIELEREAGLEAWARQQEDLLRQQQRNAEGAMVVNSPLGGGIAGSLGVDPVSIFNSDVIGQMKTGAEMVKAIYDDVKSSAGSAIGSMIDGLSQLAINWVLTGKFSGKAALQMAAGILMGVGIQAAVKGVFELAEAAAAAARYDFVSAALHKTAAGIYFKTAAIAGSIGVGIGLASRAVGGEGDASGASGGARNSQGDGRPQETRLSSGGAVNFGGGVVFGELREVVRQGAMVNAELIDTMQQFKRQITSEPAGVWVKRGIDENPRAALDGVNRSIEQGGSSAAEPLMRNLGFAR